MTGSSILFSLALAAAGLLAAGLPLLHRQRRESAGLRRAAQLAERRWRHLLDHAGDAVFFIDPARGILQEVNRRGEELLGYRAEEIRALAPQALFPGRMRRRYLRLLQRVLRDGYGEDGSLVFRRKDGSEFVGAVHARLGELGEERVVHAALRDVTELKRVERELRRRNRDLTLLNEIVRSAAESRDLRGMLETILERVLQAFAADGGGVYLLRHEGKELHLLVHRHIEEEVLAELRRAVPGQGLAGGIAADGRPRASADLRQDGRLRAEAVRRAGWRGFQAVPLTADRKTVGVLFLFCRSVRLPGRDEVRLLLTLGRQVGTTVERAQLFDDLTWQHRLTQASNRELERSRQQLRASLNRMEEANRALERLDRMKSNFLALASHELRTPLTCVLSGAELLAIGLQGRLTSGEARALEAVHQGGKRLEEIVQDLLEMARLESKSLYLACEAVDLPALVTEIGREFRPVLEGRRLSWQVAEFPASLELYGDPHHLKRTFVRLLENAVKFTPEGGCIEVRADLRTPAEIRAAEPRLHSFSPAFFAGPVAGRLLQITVRDSGVGIDPEEQVRVFDKFYEIGDVAAHSTSRTRFGGKGVGLGLTLVKGMVEAHGGMVWVESAGSGGAGSAFHVLLPLADRGGGEIGR